MLTAIRIQIAKCNSVPGYRIVFVKKLLLLPLQKILKVSQLLTFSGMVFWGRILSERLKLFKEDVSFATWLLIFCTLAAVCRIKSVFKRTATQLTLKSRLGQRLWKSKGIRS